jgi:hypothetical protein
VYRPVFKTTLTYLVLLGMALVLIFASWSCFISVPRSGLASDGVSPDQLAEATMWITIATVPLAAARLFIYARESFLRSVSALPAEQQKPRRRTFAFVTALILTGLAALGTGLYLFRAKTEEAVARAEEANIKYSSITNGDGTWSQPEDGVTVGTSIPVHLYCNRRYRLHLTCGEVTCELTFLNLDKNVQESWSSSVDRVCKGKYFGDVKPTTVGSLRLRAVLTRGKEKQVLELPPVPVRSPRPADARPRSTPDEG